MRFIDTLLLSTRMFTTRPLRTFLTVLGVSVGIGTVLFLVSLGYGLQNVILGKITTADSLLSLDVMSGPSGLISIDKNSVNKISKIKEISEISPMVNISGQITMDKFTGDGLIYIVEPSYFRLGGITPKYGELFSPGKSQNEIIISSAGAQLLNEDPRYIIGKKASLTLFLTKMDEDGFEEVQVLKRPEEYVITGVVEDENTNYVYIPRATVRDLEFDRFDQLKIKVAQDISMEKVRSEIMGMGFLVSSLSDTIEQAKKIFKVVQIVLGLFGLVALAVSAIGMFNTMTIALLERINEIGIMRAIGVAKIDIMKLFLIESIIMGFLGGVGGVIVGYLGSKIANLGINLLARNFGGQSFDLFYQPPWFIGVIIIFSTLIGVFTGVYPSIKASRLNPLKALRYK